MNNLLNINYVEKITTLLKEIFKLKKYKAMNKVLAVFTFIIMLPTFASTLSVAAVLYIFSYLFRLAAIPSDYLKSLLNNEGKEVYPSTQFILYFISWPVIFTYYVLISGLLVIITIFYTILNIDGYICSLGGFKFHLYANQIEDISIEVKGQYNIVLPLVLIIITAIVSLVLPTLHGAITYVILYYNYLEHTFTLFFYGTYLKISGLFIPLYTLLFLCPNPRLKDIEKQEINE